MASHQPNLQWHNSVAFVLGNGRSRLSLNLNELKKCGKIYGCNGLYRDFDPDYLIAVDEKMVKEIVESKYHYNRPVWTNPNKGVLSISGLNLFRPHKGWSSGPTALWFAATNGHREIYIHGFDYTGIDNKLNNVYADTKNYKHSCETATFYGNWLKQTVSVIKEFNQINFYRVIDEHSFIPDQLREITKNFSHITHSEFLEKFTGTVFK